MARLWRAVTFEVSQKRPFSDSTLTVVERAHNDVRCRRHRVKSITNQILTCAIFAWIETLLAER